MAELNYEQKLAKVMMELRLVRPFYSALYESMEKVETNSVETMGVTTNKLFYNKDFVEEQKFEDLMFINLHEIAHVALMHVARRENRDPELWNIACDLYVNASLADEFGLKLGTMAIVNEYLSISMPVNALYCSSIDIDKDYVEEIYEDLYNQGKKNGYNSHKAGTYKFTYKGSKQPDYGSRISNEAASNQTFDIEIQVNSSGTINSNSLGKKLDKDLINDGSDQSTKEQQSRKLLSDALVRSELNGSQSVGNSSGNIERLVKELLQAKLNWKKLFKKYLIQITSSDSSFNIPDKRMYYQKAIYPGRMAEESNHINGVKICIDTSGSISDDDMSRFYYQVLDILKQFKVDSELIFWDTEIYKAGRITSKSEFNRVNCYGGGGTIPSSVFDHFIESKEKPRVILMFTDGYYYDNWSRPEYKKKFKDTIWIMTKGYNKEFKPDFGKLAVAKFDGGG